MAEIKKSYIAVVLDKSGSMDPLRQKTIDMFNAVADGIAVGAKNSNLETRVTLHTFGRRGTGSNVFINEPAGQVPILTRADYIPSGGTAMLDGVGDTLTMLKNLSDANREDVNFLVIVLTDGDENDSYRFDDYKLNSLIKEVERTGRWTIAFNVPNERGVKFLEKFHIPSDNIRVWDVSEQGMADTATVTSRSIEQYMSNSAQGIAKSTNFYLDVNLKNLTSEDIRKKLQDVTKNFKSAVVTKHTSIKEFVELEVKRNYTIGSTYYALTKSETIRPHSKVLIMEKNKRTIWGGEAARTLIGLPASGGSEAKVKIENLDKYDIYVQSTSLNRKLIPSTKILIDLTLTKDLAHTW